jgi:predicted DNA-binding protein
VTETSGGVKTLAIRLPDELHAQLVLVAQLDGLSLAEAIRQAVEASISRRRDDGELAARAQAALEQIEQESALRRTALQALLGPAATPAQPAVPEAEAPKPGSRRRGGETPA